MIIAIIILSVTLLVTVLGCAFILIEQADVLDERHTRVRDLED